MACPWIPALGASTPSAHGEAGNPRSHVGKNVGNTNKNGRAVSMARAFAMYSIPPSGDQNCRTGAFEVQRTPVCRRAEGPTPIDLPIRQAD